MNTIAGRVRENPRGKHITIPENELWGPAYDEAFKHVLAGAVIERELDYLAMVLEGYVEAEVAKAAAEDEAKMAEDEAHVMEGGARRAYKQRGGGLKEAFAQMRRNWADSTSSAVGIASSVLGGAVTTFAGTPMATIKSIGLAAAAYSVAYGPTVAPYLTSVLMKTIDNVPSAVSTITLNTLSAMATAGQLGVLGAIGTGALAYFGICAGVVYNTNRVLFRRGREFAAEAVNIVATVAGTTDEDADTLIEQASAFLDAARAPATAGAGAVPTAFKYGIMVVSGPNAERLIRVMANTDTKLASVQKRDGSGRWVDAELVPAAAGGAGAPAAAGGAGGGSFFGRGGSRRRRSRSHRSSKRKSHKSKKRHVNRKTRRS